MILKSAPRTLSRRNLVLRALLIAGIGVGACAYYQRDALRHRFATHQEGKSLRQSRELAGRGEWDAAMLAVRAAAVANPGGIDPLRQAASILEDTGVVAAVAQRGAICRLVPDSVPDRIAWAQAALRFRDLDAAQQALAGFAPEQRKAPEVAFLLATYAVARGQADNAREALAQAQAENPGDAEIAFELAALDLLGASPEGFAVAHSRFEAIARASGVRRQAARRELLLVASARGLPEEAARWAELAAEDPEATYDDHIRRLNAGLALQGWLQPEAWARAVAAARTPTDQAQLAGWLVLIGQPRRASDWLSSLGPVADQAPLLAKRADAAAALGDWPAFFQFVRKGAWGEVSGDALDLARGFQILRERQRLEASRTVWLEAVMIERRNPAGLNLLLRLTELWKLPDYKKLTLTEMALSSPGGAWAVQQLVDSALEAGDTKAVQTSWRLLLQIEPTNRRSANEWAYASLLLEGGPPAPEVTRRVEELARLEPTNPRFVRTHALALWRDRRFKAALALLETLPEEARRRPDIALYYGLLLAANKRPAEAPPYLALARLATLLPEESKLLQNAFATVATAPPALESARK